MGDQLDFFQSPRKSFYNTPHLKSDELRSAESTAKSQEARILELYQDGKARNAYEAYVELRNAGELMIKDSVKRAITNLMNEGKLIKTKIKTKGEYHIDNYQYIISKPH